MRQRLQYGSIAWLVLAGLTSTATSCWGLFALGWGGPTNSERPLYIVFWSLPMLSLLVFFVYFASVKFGLWAATLLSLGIYLTLLIPNWKDCMAGKCTTSNPFLISLSPFMWVGHLWFQVISSASLFFASRTRKHISPVALQGKN
jgi:hypothetical protein